jgi:predicted acyltransferase
MAASTGEAAAAVPDQRVLSIDALRGFDMFWIIGGFEFVGSILAFLPRKVQNILVPQCEHVDWAGFHFCDLIFPLFVFLVGMTTVFSITKAVERHGKAGAYSRVIRRFLLLFVLGVFYSNGLADGWSNVRWLGVLQRIAISYLFTSILFMHLRLRGLIITAVTILIAYWAFLSFVPVPGVEKISFEPNQNWTNYLDSRFLPGRKYDGQWDPEGLLSAFPAVVTCLLGVFAALFLRTQLSNWKKVLWLIGGGAVLAAIGYAWALPSPVHFPIIKKIWSSSFVLVAGGYSCILLGIFYVIVDVWKFQFWATPFFWIGSNAITMYMLHNMVDFVGLAHRIIGPDVERLVGKPIGHFLLMTVAMAMLLAVARLLYRNKIFIRV